MTELEAMPVIIDGPGEYVARDGNRVTIHKITVSEPNTTAFTAKGSRWRTFRGAYRACGFDTWHISGRHLATSESKRDIMAKYAADEKTKGNERERYEHPDAI